MAIGQKLRYLNRLNLLTHLVIKLLLIVLKYCKSRPVTNLLRRLFIKFPILFEQISYEFLQMSNTSNGASATFV